MLDFACAIERYNLRLIDLKSKAESALVLLKTNDHLLYLLAGEGPFLEQLNGAASDLPGALLTNLIAWMRLMGFEVKHIAGTTNTGADGLSRRGREHPSDIAERNEEDIDEWIAGELGSVSVSVTSASRPVIPDHDSPRRILMDKYSDESEEMAQFLTTLKRPDSVKPRDYRNFKNRALR